MSVAEALPADKAAYLLRVGICLKAAFYRKSSIGLLSGGCRPQDNSRDDLIEGYKTNVPRAKR